jgi:hypothetical protein
MRYPPFRFAALALTVRAGLHTTGTRINSRAAYLPAGWEASSLIKRISSHKQRHGECAAVRETNQAHCCIIPAVKNHQVLTHFPKRAMSALVSLSR